MRALIATRPGTLELGEAFDNHGIIHRPTHCASDECGDRRCDAGNCVHAAWNLFNIDAWVTHSDGHLTIPFFELGACPSGIDAEPCETPTITFS